MIDLAALPAYLAIMLPAALILLLARDLLRVWWRRVT